MSKLICDSSSLISLGNICALGILPYLKEKHNTEFIVPHSVKEEIVNKPMKTKEFKLKAIKFRELIDKGIIEVEKTEKAKKKSEQIKKDSNQLLINQKNKKPIEIVHEGEARTIALLKELNTHNLLIDERTTRLLVENINQLKEYIQSESKIDIEINDQKKKKIREETKEINVMRSSEIIAIAYEENYFPEKNREILEGSLYAAKFAGCGIKNKEIKDYLHLIEGKR